MSDPGQKKAVHETPTIDGSDVQPFMTVDSKPAMKPDDVQFLHVPSQSSFASSSDTYSHSSTYSADNDNERRTGRLLSGTGEHRLSSVPVAPPRTWRHAAFASWTKNKGLALVTLSQLFGVMMSVTTRLLEMNGHHGPGMHPFQILLARMAGTIVLSGTYQWAAKVEHAPFGPRAVWKLLLARGFGGFFGVYGMYYSLQYLPLSDATVITFLAPTVACWACSILINEPFTRSEQVAGIISFIGVVFIARPISLLPHASTTSSTPSGSGIDGSIASANATRPADPQGLSNVTSAQRLGAVGVALIGVLGAACAYTTIRWIGQRAHPLISVNYFAAWSALVSAVALLAVPDIGFRLPASLVQWAYLVFLGVCGFVMQFLLTAGLAYEKSSRATNMVYTQMLFALAFDKVVWNTSPTLMSMLGSGLILGSALYVAIHNNKVNMKQKTPEGDADEEVGLMAEDDDQASESGVEGAEPLRGVQEVQLRTLRV